MSDTDSDWRVHGDHPVTYLADGSLQARVRDAVEALEDDPKHATSRHVATHVDEPMSTVSPTLHTLYEKGVLARKWKATGTGGRWVYHTRPLDDGGVDGAAVDDDADTSGDPGAASHDDAGSDADGDTDAAAGDTRVRVEAGDDGTYTVVRKRYTVVEVDTEEDGRTTTRYGWATTETFTLYPPAEPKQVAAMLAARGAFEPAQVFTEALVGDGT